MYGGLAPRHIYMYIYVHIYLMPKQFIYYGIELNTAYILIHGNEYYLCIKDRLIKYLCFVARLVLKIYLA